MDFSSSKVIVIHSNFKKRICQIMWLIYFIQFLCKKNPTQSKKKDVIIQFLSEKINSTILFHNCLKCEVYLFNSFNDFKNKNATQV